MPPAPSRTHPHLHSLLLRRYQAELETERSTLKRRATNAEEQLRDLQNYIDTNMASYQREIKESRAKGKADGTRSRRASREN